LLCLLLAAFLVSREGKRGGVKRVVKGVYEIMHRFNRTVLFKTSFGQNAVLQAIIANYINPPDEKGWLIFIGR
jgi:hypothetical protein